jgi:hypothetical protein
MIALAPKRPKPTVAGHGTLANEHITIAQTVIRT